MSLNFLLGTPPPVSLCSATKPCTHQPWQSRVDRIIAHKIDFYYIFSLHLPTVRDCKKKKKNEIGNSPPPHPPTPPTTSLWLLCNIMANIQDISLDKCSDPPATPFFCYYLMMFAMCIFSSVQQCCSVLCLILTYSFHALAVTSMMYLLSFWFVNLLYYLCIVFSINFFFFSLMPLLASVQNPDMWTWATQRKNNLFYFFAWLIEEFPSS